MRVVLSVTKSHLAVAGAYNFTSESSIFSIITKAKDLGARAKAKVSQEMKDLTAKLAEEYNVGQAEIAKVLAEPNTLNMMKAFGYSIKTLGMCLRAAAGAVNNGVVAAVTEFSESTAGQGLAKGSKKVDEFLDKHPMVKKLAGPAIAGLLAYQWINMSYLGDTELDFDISYIGEALAGNYSVEDILASPDGLSNMVYVATLVGTAGALNFPYLIKEGYDLAAAVTYTAIKNRDRITGKVSELANKIKAKLQTSSAAHAPVTKTDTPKQNLEIADWWNRLSDNGRESYLKEHPNSSYKL